MLNNDYVLCYCYWHLSIPTIESKKYLRLSSDYMKSIFINIKNLSPYLLLIAIYFFFVNIEARNTKFESHEKNTENVTNADSDPNKSIIRIAIPVIPYNQ